MLAPLHRNSTAFRAHDRDYPSLRVHLAGSDIVYPLAMACNHPLKDEAESGGKSIANKGKVGPRWGG